MQELKFKHRTLIYDKDQGLYIDFCVDNQEYSAYLFKLKHSGKMLIASDSIDHVDFDMFRQAVSDLLQDGSIIQDYCDNYFPVV